MNTDSENNALPLDGGPGEADEQADAEGGGFQVIEALSVMLGGEAVDAFEFDEDLVVDEEVGL